jgi:hypothetical protein
MFDKFSNSACPWNLYNNDDWEIVSRNSINEDNCADICINTEKCTGFEMAKANQYQNSEKYGILENGYCALWYNSYCSPIEMLVNTEKASTYLMIGSYNDDYESGSSSHFFYSMVLGLIMLICCISWCCCIRKYIRKYRLRQLRNIGNNYIDDNDNNELNIIGESSRARSVLTFVKMVQKSSKESREEPVTTTRVDSPINIKEEEPEPEHVVIDADTVVVDTDTVVDAIVEEDATIENATIVDLDLEANDTKIVKKTEEELL